MKLYIYDHRPFCTKARMIFGLKGQSVPVEVLAEDDIATPTRLVGKKMVPILQKADGSHMPESMDIVHYIDTLTGTAIATGGGDEALKSWSDAAWAVILPLTLPRIARADLPEFATTSARAAFTARQSARFGDFDALLGQTDRLIQQAEAHLAKLEPLLEARTTIDADDFQLYPQLRMLSIVKDLAWPPTVHAYLERLSHQSGVPLHSALAS